MKKTCVAPSNIAFIKFWGKKNSSLVLPNNSSFSMCLSGVETTTTVEFDEKYKTDDVNFLDSQMSEKEKERIIKQLNVIRKLAKTNLKAKVRTKNNFPKSSGIASSASGMAALTVAAVESLKMKLNKKQLSVLARQGSGSACRSVPSGFVVWHKGKSSQSSFAETLKPKEYWGLYDVILIVSSSEKKVSSTSGHAGVQTSPFYKTRIKNAKQNYQKCVYFFLKKDFLNFAEIVEKDCFSMHSVMMTQDPPLLYFQPKTIELIKKIRELREEKKWKICFTIDAGPNVHVICENQNFADKIKELFKRDKEVEKILISKVGQGARLIADHLF